MSDSRLFESVANRLIRAIETGEWPAGSRIPAERDLAARMGVSRPTLRRAIKLLSDRGFLIRAQNCRPRVAGVGAAQPVQTEREYHVFVLLFTHVADLASAPMLRGIQRVRLPGFGKTVVVSSGAGPWVSAIDFERKQLRAIAQDPLAKGVILWYVGGEHNLDVLAAVRNADVPMVFIDRRPPPGIVADHVGTDNRGAMRRLVRALQDLGHRRIACISNGEPVSSVEDRVWGYRAAMRRSGQTPDQDLLGEIGPDESMEDGTRRCIQHLLQADPRPTAILCTNDMVGSLAMRELKARGLRVPDDISVAGFDGWYRFAPGMGLSSAAQNFEDIGESAMELLVERITGPREPLIRHILFDAPLADSGSIGPVPAPN
ncbi:MAG: GntR family transcriptional regulator [Fimbriimonadaceae bacterium]|nr:GntR family transcriptional regulator [Fimbriimonadaceae bacterium]